MIFEICQKNSLSGSCTPLTKNVYILGLQKCFEQNLKCKVGLWAWHKSNKLFKPDRSTLHVCKIQCGRHKKGKKGVFFFILQHFPIVWGHMLFQKVWLVRSDLQNKLSFESLRWNYFFRVRNTFNSNIIILVFQQKIIFLLNRIPTK